jgi:hypothetical protein
VKKTFERVPNIEDFVNADDLAASGVLPFDDMIDAVSPKEDGDKCTAQTVPTKPLVTNSQAQNVVQILINFFE